MTFEQYINNPLQTRLGGNTREIYRMMYTGKLDALLVRVNNDIKFKTLKNKKDGSYYLYIKIPSEVVKDFTYDVVIRFKRPGHNVDFDKDLKAYDVEFFSNDPAFVYNLEYTFKSKDMFIKDLTPKASKMALKKEPKVTNPNNQIIYCKSLYFAYLIMKQRGLFVKSIYLDNYDKKRLLEEIEDSDVKIERRQELGAEANKEERKIKEQSQIKRTLNKSKLGRSLNYQVSSPDFSLKAVDFNRTGTTKKNNAGAKINFNKAKKI